MKLLLAMLGSADKERKGDRSAWQTDVRDVNKTCTKAGLRTAGCH